MQELNSGSDEFVGDEGFFFFFFFFSFVCLIIILEIIVKEWFKGLEVAFLEKVGYKLSQHDIKMLQIGVIEGVDR